MAILAEICTCRCEPAENLRSAYSGGVEFPIGELVLQLVPQLHHACWQPIDSHLAEPRLNDLKQEPLPGRLQANRTSRPDRLEREPDLEPVSALIDAFE
jgi:hypothetical protein